MKMMRCNELGGACDKEFFGDTFEEIAKQSKEHGIEMINLGDKSVKYVGRNASSSTATGNLNKHLAQQKEILEKILKD